MNSLAELRKNAARQITSPIVQVIRKSKVTPDSLTWIGLLINIAAGAIIAYNHLIIGGVLVLVSGLFDILDGALARSTNKTTRFGALLDSTFDRLSEAAIFVGLLILYLGKGEVLMPTLVSLAMVGSFVTSYVRARAEGLGLDCQTGLFTRAERVIILVLGLMFNPILVIVMAILVALSFVTVGQRMAYVWAETKTGKC
jgi:CDP-diacylglycerol--glycerol-3-phosphate 3-phosphatidyltransferase